MKLLFSFLILSFLLLSGCATEQSDTDSSTNADNQRASDIRHATGFRFIQQDGLDVIRVMNPWRRGETLFDYVLLPEGASPPATLSDKQILVKLPLKSPMQISTSHAGLFLALNSGDRITGFSNPDFLYNEELRTRAADGTLSRFGPPESRNMERILQEECDFLMMSATEALPQLFDRLRQVDIPVFMNADWMERTPLGRAEWLRVVGLLIGKQREADSLFSTIEADYLEIQKLVGRNAGERLSVFTGVNYRGTWYMPGGKSYVAKLLGDAAAEYTWADYDSSSGSLPLSFEQVLQNEIDTHYWLQPGIHTSMKSLLAEDERYGEFAAYKNGNVYNSTARSNANGSSDYWESGLVRPNLLLRDIAKILYPDQLPDHQLMYYERLSQE